MNIFPFNLRAPITAVRSLVEMIQAQYGLSGSAAGFITTLIATIAALTTLGNVESQLKFHISAGLNIGLTTEEINEIMLLMTVYAGFPAAINGTNILKEVVQELDS